MSGREVSANTLANAQRECYKTRSEGLGVDMVACGRKTDKCCRCHPSIQLFFNLRRLVLVCSDKEMAWKRVDDDFQTSQMFLILSPVSLMKCDALISKCGVSKNRVVQSDNCSIKQS